MQRSATLPYSTMMGSDLGMEGDGSSRAADSAADFSLKPSHTGGDDGTVDGPRWSPTLRAWQKRVAAAEG